MKAPRFLLAMGLAGGICAGGCEESVPVNPKSSGGGNPYVSGTPEERIKRIESDASLTPEEKQRRIAVIKERNNIK